MPSVHLHLRILPLDVAPVVPVETLIEACEKVFSQAKVSIKVESKRPLEVSDDDKLTFSVLKVHDGCAGKAVTAEQEALFKLAPGINPLDVVVFLVQDTNRTVRGCAQHPDGRPGAIVTSLCDQWTLAHELGHLLGLVHVSEKSQLMFNRGTLGIAANPPRLTPGEITTIRASTLLR